MTKLFPFPRILLLLASAALAMPAARAQQPMQEQAQDSPAKAPTQLELMQRVEDSWSNAIAKRDQYGLELVLAPQFVNISASGDVRTRNQDIVNTLSADSGLISVEQKVVSVRTLGDVALVNGTYILRRKQSGQTVDEKGIFTHVFERTRSHWQCINAQRTVVVEQPLQKGKPANMASKKGSAELPFHVPLFHKGGESDRSQSSQPPQP